MRPVLFELPFLGKEIPAFGLMMTLGFLLGIYWAVRRAIKSGANPDVVLNIGFIALIAGVVGCRIMFVWHYWDEQFAQIQPIGNRIWAILNLTQGGMEFYGGFLLTCIAVFVYLWGWGHSIRWYLDIVAPSLAIGMAFGRVGCFLNGCCFGGPCNLPWAVEFPYGSNPAVVQWEKRLPGTSLPQELVDSTTFPSPIRLQSLLASDKKVDAAVAQANRLELELAALKQKSAPPDEIRLAQAKLALVPYPDLRRQMKRYDLSAEEIRTMAHAHGSIPIHPAQLYSTAGLLVLG
ncbi:MAG: prolipoprotein diacylglyceryl transferase family protein, partial [Phycisphaerae bacterium]